MKKLLALAFLLFASPAWAQNPQCPTRPVGDSTNACASTAFVQSAAGTDIFGTPHTWTALQTFSAGIVTNNIGQTGSGASGVPVSIGSSLYPVYNTSGKSYDLNSAFLVNTIGAKWGVFGSASKDQPSWLELYAPGVSFFNVGANVASISELGTAGGLFAARTSDNNNPASAMLPLNCFAIADNTTVNQPASWCLYLQSNLLASSNPTVTGANAQHFQIESSVQSFWTPSATITPYNVNAVGSTRNLRLDCGIANPPAIGQTNCDAVIDVVLNGKPYQAGIIFGATALDTAAGRIAPAIWMATDYSVQWSASGGTIGRLRSNGADQLIWDSDSGAAQFELATSATGRATFYADSSQSILASLTNIPLLLKVNNTTSVELLTAGNVKFNNAASFSANASVATVLGSIGPVGSHTTVQKWLTIVDSGGATLYIPAF